MRVLELPAVSSEIANALDFISNSLGEFGVTDKKTLQDAMLATEESLIKLLEHTPDSSMMEISVKKNLIGKVAIGLAIPGEVFDFYKDMGWHEPLNLEAADTPDIECELRGVVMTCIDGDLKYENKKNVNSVHVAIK